MAKLQITVDDDIKAAAESVFNSQGLTTSAAVRLFLSKSADKGKIPFRITAANKRKPNAELLEAMEDARLRRNLHGPFNTAEEAVQAMLQE